MLHKLSGAALLSYASRRLGHWRNVAALKHLSGLQKLLLNTLGDVDKTVCEAFAELRGLEDLSFGFSWGPKNSTQISAAALLQPTQMTQLTRLLVVSSLSGGCPTRVECKVSIATFFNLKGVTLQVNDPVLKDLMGCTLEHNVMTYRHF